jgi:hypothetical protein
VHLISKAHLQSEDLTVLDLESAPSIHSKRFPPFLSSLLTCPRLWQRTTLGPAVQKARRKQLTPNNQHQGSESLNKMRLNSSRPLREHRPTLRAMGSSLLLLTFAVVAAGCSSTVEGQLISSGDPFGEFTIDFTSCVSGEREEFLGVYLLSDADDGGMKVMDDPVRAEVVLIEVPGSCDSAGDNCRVEEVDRAQCSTHEVAINRSNVEVGEARLIDGHLKLNCVFERGSVEANVKFDGCR